MMEMGWLREDMLFGDAPQKAELQGFIDKVKQIGDAGIEMGHVFCALKTDRNLDEEWKRITNFFQELGNHAKQSNVKIANHMGWSPEYIIRDRVTFKKFLDNTNRYIGINMCLGCLQIVSPEDIAQEIDETMEIMGERLFLVHIRDIKVEEGNKWVDVAMGQGEIRLDIIVDRLCNAYWNRSPIRPIVLPEHMPKVPNEQHNEISTAWALGYVSGMVKQWGLGKG
jgi:D-mannonate dehydratase